jgi:hypothetical protein
MLLLCNDSSSCHLHLQDELKFNTAAWWDAILVKKYAPLML